MDYKDIIEHLTKEKDVYQKSIDYFDEHLKRVTREYIPHIEKLNRMIVFLESKESVG